MTEKEKSVVYRNIGSAMMIAGLTLMAYSVFEPKPVAQSQNTQVPGK